MKKVYVAGALNAMAVDYIQNMSIMMEHAEMVRKAGYAVFIPCIDILMGIKFGDWEYDDFFKNSQPFLEACDAVYVCPKSKDSNGTQAEIGRAMDLGIPVVYNIKQLKLHLEG